MEEEDSKNIVTMTEFVLIEVGVLKGQVCKNTRKS